MCRYRKVVRAGGLASVTINGGNTVEACIKRLSQPEGDERTLDSKVVWSGVITAVQPRIRLTRSLDEWSHSYLGYLLRITGTLDGADSEFRVGVGPEAHAKQQFGIGDAIEGVGVRVVDPRLEIADIYRATKLSVLRRGGELNCSPPWHGLARRRCQSIGNGHTDAWQQRRMSRNAKAVSGAVPCQSRSSLTTGIRNGDVIGPKPFAMDRCRVLYIGRGQRARFRAGMEWSTKSLTG